MKTPERLFDYFTLEANEQIAILEEEASRDTQPDVGRFVAAARRLTSSARMARLTGLAEISGGIERLARELVRNEIPWTSELRHAVLDGLRELRVSVARVKELDEGDYIRLRRHSREVLRFTRNDLPEEAPVPISRLFFDDTGPHIVRLASAKTVDSAVPIEQLLYRGREALDRAREIRARSRAEQRSPTEQDLAELLDLIDLAAAEGP